MHKLLLLTRFYTTQAIQARMFHPGTYVLEDRREATMPCVWHPMWTTFKGLRRGLELASNKEYVAMWLQVEP